MSRNGHCGKCIEKKIVICALNNLTNGWAVETQKMFRHFLQFYNLRFLSFIIPKWLNYVHFFSFYQDWFLSGAVLLWLLFPLQIFAEPFLLSKEDPTTSLQKSSPYRLFFQFLGIKLNIYIGTTYILAFIFYYTNLIGYLTIHH